MKNKKLFLFFLMLFALCFQASSLKLTGTEVLFKIDFSPNYTREDSFSVTNAEEYIETYDIFPIKVKGEDLSKYFTITPNRIENNPIGESVGFKVRLELPEKLDSPGENEMFVKVKIDTSSDGAMRAIPSVALRYIVFVLYPFKFNTWSFSALDMNVNETKIFTLSINNIGEPVIEKAFADIVIKSKETNGTVKTIKTDIGRNIQPKESRQISASFDSIGLMPGEYVATPVFYWDSNVSYISDESFKLSDSKTDFKIGEKGVDILNFTKLFEVNAINKMDIKVESTWNTKIKNMYADTDIYDLESNQKLKSFRSLSYDLDPWQIKSFDAYFDTHGLEKKEYKAIVTLFYDGSQTSEESIIKIDENINAVTVEEIPGKFKINFSQIFTTMNILVSLLLIFILINIFMFFNYFKKSKIIFDPSVIEKVKELKKKYSDEYIKENMIKKGWEEEKINLILKEADKK